MKSGITGGLKIKIPGRNDAPRPTARSYSSLRVAASVLIAVLILSAGTFAQQKKTAVSTTSRTKGKSVRVTDTSAVKKITADYGKYDFTLTTLEGKKFKLSDYEGRVVLVNIWAPWCGPCKVEIPGFAKLRRKYGGKGFEILGVAVQTSESAVRDFMKDFEMKWPVGLNGDVPAKYGTYGLPDNYLFGPDGKVIKHFVGYTREEALEPLIVDALKKLPSK